VALLILINAAGNRSRPDFDKPAVGLSAPSEFGDGEMPDDNAEPSSCPSPQRQPGSTACIAGDRGDPADRDRLVLFPVSLTARRPRRPISLGISQKKRPRIGSTGAEVDLWREETGQGCDLKARKAQPRPVGLTCPR